MDDRVGQRPARFHLGQTISQRGAGLPSLSRLRSTCSYAQRWIVRTRRDDTRTGFGQVWHTVAARYSSEGRAQDCKR